MSTGDPNRPGTACDTITEITPARAQTLRNAGYLAVGRYLAKFGTLTAYLELVAITLARVNFKSLDDLAPATGADAAALLDAAEVDALEGS